jgi:hypothetical protein
LGKIGLAVDVLRYASVKSDQDARSTLERLCEQLDSRLLVVIDGLNSTAQIEVACGLVDGLLRQVSNPFLCFMLVARTVPPGDISAFSLLKASIYDEPDVGHSFFRLREWDLPTAGRAWDSARGPHVPMFAEFPDRVQRLLCLPLYQNLAMTGGSELLGNDTSGLAVIDQCVRGTLSAVDADTDTLVDRIGRHAVAAAGELSAIFPGSMATHEVPLAEDLEPLARLVGDGSLVFNHEIIGEYFQAVRVANVLLTDSASSAVHGLNELARVAEGSASACEVLQFVVERLDQVAPAVLCEVGLSTLPDSMKFAPRLVGLAGERSRWFTADVLGTLLFRSVGERSAPLARALLRSPIPARLGVQRQAIWLVELIRTFGPQIWPDVVERLEADTQVTRCLFETLNLSRPDDATFLARYRPLLGDSGASLPLALLGHPDSRVRAALAQHVPSHLVGRDRELEILQGQLGQVVTTRRPAVALIRGEAGIGKSTLLKSWIEAAVAKSADPPLIGYGQSMTHSLGSDAFQALREYLRSLAANAEHSGSKDALERVGDALHMHARDWLESVTLVSSVLATTPRAAGSIPRGTDTAGRSNSRLNQFTRFVMDLVRTGPLVIVLDDLQWADTATLDIIVALALKADGPLLLVLAYRPDDLRPGPDGQPHPLTHALSRLYQYPAGCLEIDLHRLSDPETESLIRGLNTVGAMPDDYLRRLAAQSHGIPLYAESLALVHGRGSERSNAGDPPRKVADVIEERLSFVTPEDQRLLEVAALVGFTFEVDLVAELTRVNLDEVFEALDRLMRDHRLIVGAAAVGDLDRYALYHPMLAQILRARASQNAPRWRRYHQRLVDLLLAQQLTDEIAVRAASAAIIASDARAVDLALDAAGRQYRAGAVTRARELAEMALPAADGTKFFAIAELLARSLSAEANHRDAAAVCARALSGARAGSVARTRLRDLRLLHIRSLRMINSWTAVEELLLGLQTQLPTSSTARQARAEMLMLRAETALCGPVQDIATCVAACEEVIKETPDGALRSRALGHRGLAHLAAYQPDEAENGLRLAVDAARAAGHPYAEYEAVHWLSKKKLACLELADAAVLLKLLAETSQVSGVARDIPFHRRDASRLLALQGDTVGSVAAFLQYYDLTAAAERDRVLTVLTCQVHEAEAVHGTGYADRLVDALGEATLARAPCSAGMTDPRAAAERLGRRPRGWAPLLFAVAELQVDPGEAGAAEAIFRFDVPDLTRLRRRTGR